MAEDHDLELLKRRKLLEMQRHLLKEKALEAERAKTKKSTEKPREPEEVVIAFFADRASEVWMAAKQQYPSVVKEVAKALATIIESGKLKERITGEQLYWLFQQLRLPIRLETKIRILESGELKTIAQKLKER